MSAATKMLEAMRENLRDLSLAQLQSVAKRHNIGWRHRDGSHCIFVWGDGRSLSVPSNRPIKPIYVRMFLNLIEGL